MEPVVLTVPQTIIGTLGIGSLGYGLAWLLRKKAAEKKKK